MKTLHLIFFISLLISLISCEKDELINSEEEVAKIDNGITFRQYDMSNGVDTSATITFISYDGIIGYDSTRCAFVLEKTAWEKLDDGIKPIYPDPHF